MSFHFCTHLNGIWRKVGIFLILHTFWKEVGLSFCGQDWLIGWDSLGRHVFPTHPLLHYHAPTLPPMCPSHPAPTFPSPTPPPPPSPPFHTDDNPTMYQTGWQCPLDSFPTHTTPTPPSPTPTAPMSRLPTHLYPTESSRCTFLFLSLSSCLCCALFAIISSSFIHPSSPPP